MNNVGWGVMVTGQSVVLYSRLGIILHHEKTLRFVLWMIVVDTAVFYTSTTVIHYGTYSAVHGFAPAAAVIEKIQMTVFCVQQFIISGLYVREVWRLSKVLTQKSNARRIMWELLAINLILILLDIALLALEYLSYSVLEKTFKGLAYSFKLKMEFAILGKLIAISRTNSSGKSWLGGPSLGEKDGPSLGIAASETERVATMNV